MDEWRPLTANLTAFGLSMFAGYLFAARLCHLASAEWKLHPSRKRRGTRAMRQERAIWAVITVALIIGAFYRQFDVQNLISGIGRRIAKGDMLYDIRRPYQAALIGAFSLVLLIAVGALLNALRRINPLALVALVAALILGALQVLKAISLHQIDAIMQAGIGGINAYNLLETSALATAALMAFFYRQQSLIVRGR